MVRSQERGTKFVEKCLKQLEVKSFVLHVLENLLHDIVRI